MSFTRYSDTLYYYPAFQAPLLKQNGSFGASARLCGQLDLQQKKEPTPCGIDSFGLNIVYDYFFTKLFVTTPFSVLMRTKYMPAESSLTSSSIVLAFTSTVFNSLP